MPFIHVRPKRRPALGLLALALAPVVGTSPAGAADHPEHRSQQRLVVRGDATVVDGPCDAGVCRLALTGGRFRGTPVGTGAYTGSIRLKVADVFPNGEGGVCAPLKGRIVLGAGTGDRLVLALSGDSCQDGARPLPAASFTGLAEFTVKRGTGSYARATGTGQASFSEDAANRHRLTLVGRLAS